MSAGNAAHDRSARPGNRVGASHDLQGVHHHPEPLTWATGLSTWTFAIGWNVVILLLALAYGAGVVRLTRRAHRTWPARRTASYAAGLVAFALAMNSAIAVYSHALFTMHMVQHLVLIMLVPALLIHGKPLQLLVDLDDSGRAERILRGRAVGHLTNPVLTLMLYTVVLVATHLTSFMQFMLVTPGMHDVESALYLVTGYLTFLPMIGGEPIRWQRLAYPLRVFAAMMAMAPDTGIGVILMTADDPLFPAYGMMRDWGWSALTDQRVGGSIMWFFGDALMAVFAIVLVLQWRRAPTSETGFGSWLEAARRHALAGTSDGETPGGDAAAMESTDDVDDDERARRAYNAMLARLAGRESPDGDDAEGRRS